VRAVQLVRWQAEPEIRDVAVPEPGPGEVLVQVAAAGLCHSDLHLMEWPEGTLPWRLPFTLGHETAGTVAALGPGVAEGDPVYRPGVGGSAADASSPAFRRVMPAGYNPVWWTFRFPAGSARCSSPSRWGSGRGRST